MTVYIVQKLHWEWNDEAFVLDNDTPIKAFESRDDAEVFCRKCEAEAREEWRESESGRDETYIGEHGVGTCVEAFYEVVEMGLEP